MACVGVPTRGSRFQLVNAACFLVPDVDARGNTVTHGFYPGSGRGAVRLAKECARALYYLAPGVLVVGGYKRGERRRDAPKSLLEEESVAVCAQWC